MIEEKEKEFLKAKIRKLHKTLMCKELLFLNTINEIKI